MHRSAARDGLGRQGARGHLAEQDAGTSPSGQELVVVILSADTQVDRTGRNRGATQHTQCAAGPAQGHHFPSGPAQPDGHIEVKILPRPHRQARLFPRLLGREIQARLAAHGEVLLAATDKSNRSNLVQTGGPAPQAQVPCPLPEPDRAFGRVAHVHPDRVKRQAVEVVARRHRGKKMRRQLRGGHLKLDPSGFAEDWPTVVRESHRHQKGLTPEVMMASSTRPHAQKHRPHAPVLESDKVGMPRCLDGMPAPVAVAEHGIVRTGLERSPGRICPRGDLAMAVSGAALGSQQVGASLQGVEVRPLGPDTTRATPDHLHGSPKAASGQVQLRLLDDRMFKVSPGSVARIVDATAVEEQRGIEATFVDPDRIRPRALGS